MKKIRLDLETAKQLAVDFLARNGMPVDHAAIVADHLIYATLAGFSRVSPACCPWRNGSAHAVRAAR